MRNLLNKTFFRFAFSFIALIALSFLVISVAGYLEEREDNVPVTAEVKQ